MSAYLDAPVTPARPAGCPPFISPSAFISPADSPSASVTLLRVNETLAGLSRQLAELEAERLLESDPDLTARGCCCGAITDCPTLAARDRVDAKLKLCGGRSRGRDSADSRNWDGAPSALRGCRAQVSARGEAGALMI